VNVAQASTAGLALSAADVHAYERDGFVAIHQQLLAPAPLERLEAVLQDCLARAAAGHMPRDLNVPHTHDGRLFEALADERILDVVGSLAGPNLAMWTSQFFCKEPLTGASIGWHADAHYWTRFLQPIRVVSIWLALDDVSAENACLRVVPGSHRAGTFRYGPRRSDQHAFFPVCISEDQIDGSTVIDVELRRGEAVLFDGYLLHASGPNASTRRRRAYTMRYMPTDCRFDAVDLNPPRRWARKVLGTVRRVTTGHDIYRHRVYLARGVDVAGNQYSTRPDAAL
jgi:ectoine hydroxylase-related dioxygenase (phytanoyl-CoA dioxygenase family)